MAKAYVMDTGEIIIANEGTGDNLLQEDIDAGYVDYVYYTTYSVTDTVEEEDGGMMLLTVPFSEVYCYEGTREVNVEKLLADIVSFHYGDADYIIL